MFKLGSTLSAALICSLFIGPVSGAELGDPAPRFRVKEWIKGGPVDLRKGVGRHIYLVEFWATWCPACRTSIPHLTMLQKKYKDKGVIVIGISDERPEIVRSFVKDLGDKMDYAVAVDDNDATNRAYMRAFGVNSIPHAFIIDRFGRIAWQGSAAVEHELNKAVERVVEQKDGGISSGSFFPPAIPDDGENLSTPNFEFSSDNGFGDPMPMTEVIPNRAPTEPPSFGADEPNDSPWAALDFEPSNPVTEIEMTNTRSSTRPAYDRPTNWSRLSNSDFEIDSLDGKLYRRFDSWLLRIDYEIEIETERGFRPQGLELILSLKERGYQFLDRRKKPIIFSIPLDRPTEVDDDEVEFEGRLAIELPCDVFRNPNDLRIYGKLMHPGYEQPLDRKSESVRCKSRYYR